MKSTGTNQSIYLVDDSQTVTTSVAAEYVGVSRQYCVHILERGQIPCHYVGTHRRIYPKDVLSYLNHRTTERKAALDSMTRELVDAGLDWSAPIWYASGYIRDPAFIVAYSVGALWPSAECGRTWL